MIQKRTVNNLFNCQESDIIFNKGIYFCFREEKMDNNKVIYIIDDVHTEKKGKDLSFFNMLFYYKMIIFFGYLLGFLSIFLYFNNILFLFLFISSAIWLIYRLFCIIAYQYQNVIFFKNSEKIYFYEDYLSRKVSIIPYRGLYKYLSKMNNRIFKSLSAPIPYSEIRCFKMSKDYLLILTKYEYISIPKESYSLEFIRFLSSKIEKVQCTNETKQSINMRKIDNTIDKYYVYDALKEYLFDNLGFIIKLLIISVYLMFTADNDYFLMGIINTSYTFFALFHYSPIGDATYKRTQKIKSVFFTGDKIYLLKFKGDEKLYQFLNDEKKQDSWKLNELFFYEDKRYLQLFFDNDDRIILFDKKRQDIDLERIVEIMTENN